MKREMKWLKERSQKQVPVTFGAPWGRGELPKGSSLALIGGDGKEFPCQVSLPLFGRMVLLNGQPIPLYWIPLRIIRFPFQTENPHPRNSPFQLPRMKTA